MFFGGWYLITLQWGHVYGWNNLIFRTFNVDLNSLHSMSLPEYHCLQLLNVVEICFVSANNWWCHLHLWIPLHKKSLDENPHTHTKNTHSNTKDCLETPMDLYPNRSLSIAKLILSSLHLPPAETTPWADIPWNPDWFIEILRLAYYNPPTSG